MDIEEEYFQIWDNSTAFRDWLKQNDIEYKRNGHSTLVPFSCDIFQLGINYGLYKDSHTDNIQKSNQFQAGKIEATKEITRKLKDELESREESPFFSKDFLDGLEQAIYIIEPIENIEKQ